jgi:hypothetical protein
LTTALHCDRSRKLVTGVHTCRQEQVQGSKNDEHWQLCTGSQKYDVR